MECRFYIYYKRINLRVRYMDVCHSVITNNVDARIRYDAYQLIQCTSRYSIRKCAAISTFSWMLSLSDYQTTLMLLLRKVMKKSYRSIRVVYKPKYKGPFSIDNRERGSYA